MIKENRSLERGLIVLETLARHRAMSLADLHRATGLPKSTLRRLLATLVRQRFVRRSLADKLYRVTVVLPDISISPVPPGLALVADISLTHVLELTKKIGWPSDIHAFEGNWMRIIESTRSISPFSLYKGQIDRRVNLFGSAAGVACLSQLSAARVRALYADDTAEQRFRPDRFGLSLSAVGTHLATARKRGYGARMPNYAGETVTDDKLRAMAIAVRKDGKVWGAVSILWPRDFVDVEDFAARNLEDLKETIAAIEADLATRSANTPSHNDGDQVAN